jgi:multimeric flavodoxin WrbA
MRPLVILGSSRKDSDTRKFVDTIFEGIDHTLMDLLDLNIHGYDYKHRLSAQ